MGVCRWIAVAVGLAVPTVSLAAESRGDRPEVIVKFSACRTLEDIAAKAACYDREFDSFDSAEQNRDVQVIERNQVRKARRSLFGFALPDIELFSNKDDAEKEEFSKLETTIDQVSTNRAGQWIFTLKEGGRWAQSDSSELVTAPRSGDSIRIRRGAIGSFLANVGGQIAIRVRRIE